MISFLNTILHLFVFFTSLSGYFLFAEKKLNVPRTFAPAFVLYSIFSILYIAVIINIIKLVSIFIIIIGLILFFLIISKRLLKKENIFTLFRIEYIFFFAFASLLFLTCYWSYFYGSDILGHWGIRAKDLFFRNTLHNTQVGMKSYTPGAATFQYFICLSMGKWHEGYAFWANALLIISCLFTFYHKLNWKNVFNIYSLVGILLFAICFYDKVIWLRCIYVILFLILICLLNYNPNNRHKSATSFLFITVIFCLFNGIFGRGIIDLYVDNLLACTFVACLTIYFSNEKLQYKTYFLITPLLFSLYAIKQAGLILAILAVVIIFLDTVFQIVFFLRNKTITYKKGYTLLIITLFLLIIPLASNQLWNYYCQKENFQQTAIANLGDTKKRISSIFSPQTAREQITVKNFKDAFTEKTVLSNSLAKLPSKLKDIMIALNNIFNPPSNSYSFTLWLALVSIVVLFAFILTLSGDNFLKCRTLIFAFSLIVGGILYTLGLLYLYLYKFGSYEGPRLASYGRYICIYLLPVFLFIIFLITQLLNNKKIKSFYYYIILILLSLVVIITSPISGKFRLDPKSKEKNRLTGEQLLNSIKLPSKGNIYFVWRGLIDNPKPTIDYLLYPVYKTNNGLGAMGPKRFKGDVWANNLTVKQWSDDLKKYDYVLLGNIDNGFINTYKKLFLDKSSIENHKLFKIIDKDKTLITLKPIIIDNEQKQ